MGARLAGLPLAYVSRRTKHTRYNWVIAAFVDRNQ